jgi:hypothetical protein
VDAMRKTILIPTDFKVESLGVLKDKLEKTERNGNVKFDIILLHGTYLNESMTDYYFFSKTKLIESLSNQDFEDACMIIKNKYASSINSFRKDVFAGFTQTAFDNYVEANRINQALLCANYEFDLFHKKSFDLLPFIRKSKLMVDEVELNLENVFPENGKLNQMYAGNVMSR